jgi:CRP/FNR family transcriptional regulator/CRP/FNR family cyclic AMP-dependent transcriptional regulator
MLYLVESGQVRIFVNGLDGHETSVILCGRPGEIFGELAVIDGLPRSASAVAVTDTVVHTLNRERFRDYMRQWPRLALNFMQTLSKKVRYNTQQVDSLASMDVSRRLARKLLELGQDYGTAEAQGVRLNTALTQSDLASLIGATRESTNKVLRQFRDDGMISLNNGATIIIRDAEALRTHVSS